MTSTDNFDCQLTHSSICLQRCHINDAIRAMEECNDCIFIFNTYVV